MFSTTPQSFIDGFRLIDGTELNDKLANPQWSTTTSVTATPGGNVNTSIKVVDAITNITSAVANAGITIPQALPGKVLVVSNSTANPVIVYAAGGSTIGGVPGNVGISLTAYQTLYIFAVDTQQWMFSFSLPTQLSANTVTPALRALQPVAQQVVNVSGYYAIGDGGGGIFYGVTGAAPGTYVDNGGTIIVPTGGNGSSAWRRIIDAPVNVRWFGAKGDGVFDDTAAIQAAINSFPFGQGLVYFPKGIYLVTSTITVSQNRMNLLGEGQWVSQIKFEPTADDICLFIGKGGEGNTDGGVIFQCSVKGFSFTSDNRTNKKTALELKDIGECYFDDISIGSTVQWIGQGSIGVRVRGREGSTFNNMVVQTNRPFVFAVNTNFPTICLDHFNFNNIFSACRGNFETVPVYDETNFFFEPGANFSNVSFTGYQAWLRGKNGLYYDNSVTPASAASYAMNIQNVRWEGETGDDDTGYMFYFNHGATSSAKNIIINTVVGGEIGNGYYFRKCTDITLINCSWQLARGEALNIDTVDNSEFLQIINCFWQAGATASIGASFTPISAVRSDTASPIYKSAIYTASQSGYRRDLIAGVPINQGLIDIGAPDPTVVNLPLAAGASVVGVVTDSRSKVAIIAFLQTTKTITFIYNDGTYSATQGTAGKLNVYWDAGTSLWVLENKTGLSRELYFQALGSNQ